ncbi:MAG: hypothetical protein AWU57_1037 [Marinobacter sp. T13-3]|jgi:integrase|nr:MAG: hypothetical protein AWU57_1037 [Marinobacter sp. T13-3]
MLSASKITTLNPTFWGGANAEVKLATLEAVIRTAGETTTINPAQSKRCLKMIHRHLNGKQSGSLTDAQHKVVCQALAKINDSGLIRCAIPPAPIKATRPSVLPDNKAQWEAQDIAQAYLRDIARQLKKPESAEMAALAMVYGLVMTGYGLEPAINIISRLCQGDLEFAQNQLLRTPVHHLETGPYFHETVLPPWLGERFQRVARFNRKHKLVAGRKPAQQWAIHVTGPEPDNISGQALYQWRFDQIKQQLIDHHSREFSAWQIRQTESANDLMRRLPYFSRALRLNALTAGMEPAFYRQLEALPLPADTSSGLADFLVPSPAIGCHPARGAMINQSNHSGAPWAALSQMDTAPLPEHDLCDNVSADWAQDARFLLRELATDLHNRFTPQSKLTGKKLELLNRMLVRYWERAAPIAPGTSALQLALLWVGTLLYGTDEKAPVQINTATQYLREIIINSVLNYEGAFDLSDWSDEDVENVRMLVVNRRRLADKTRKDRQDRLGRFLTFCQSKGLLEEATLYKDKMAYALTKRRNRVLGLAQFDQLQYTIAHSAEPEAKLVNTLLTLGFYGGLRSGEMLALSLDDIEVCGPEIYVWIRRGKTAAARRKVPLHLLAPPRVCEQFLAYLDTRQAAARMHKAKLKKVAFIGPTGSVQGYKREELIPAVIGLLRYYVGPEFDMHSLRHGFGTWLMLRAYALKHPELKAQLLEQQHAVFSPEGEAKLTQLFQWTEDKPLLPGRITMFINIRKLMGHSHISVLLQNYLHAFGVLHQFLMRRM